LDEATVDHDRRGRVSVGRTEPAPGLSSRSRCESWASAALASEADVEAMLYEQAKVVRQAGR
jgi:hypothetical protein